MKVQLDKSKYSTVGRSSCSSVDEGPTKNSQPMFIKMPCIALVHSYVCLGYVRLWLGGW